MRGDVTDIIAVIFGVWFTIRKLDAQKRRTEEFPHVPPDAFRAWQDREVAVYQVAIWACFAKVLVNVLFMLFVMSHLPVPAMRLAGASIFFAWLAVMVWTFVRTSRLRRLRRDLGIVLGGFVTADTEDEEAQEGVDHSSAESTPSTDQSDAGRASDDRSTSSNGP